MIFIYLNKKHSLSNAITIALSSFIILFSSHVIANTTDNNSDVRGSGSDMDGTYFGYGQPQDNINTNYGNVRGSTDKNKRDSNSLNRGIPRNDNNKNENDNITDIPRRGSGEANSSK